MTGPFADLRHAARAFRRQPGFVATVVGTFAVAIGTNAAMLGLVDRLMLSPPPGIGSPERIVRIQVEATFGEGQSYRMSTFSYSAYEALASARRGLASVAASVPDTAMVGPVDAARPLPILKASGVYFGLLQAVPAIGRFFGPADDELPVGNAVVVLGYSYWGRAFGRDPGAIGKSVTIDGERFTIIGVARPGFNGDNVTGIDLFIPLTAGMRANGFGSWTTPQNLVTITARLANGTSPAAAADVATRALRDDFDRSERRVVHLQSIVPGAAARTTPQGRIALWLSGVSVIVLLIATANVGTLMLLRAARGQRDAAVRIALGAQRGALARELLVESMVLALLGVMTGMLLSRWVAQLIRVTLLPQIASEAGLINTRILVVSTIAGLGCAALAALSPIRLLWRRDLTGALRAAGEHGASGRLTSQGVFVGCQVALCTMLVVGASLFIRSLQRVQSQDLGFSTGNILYVTVDFQGDVRGRLRDDVHYDALRRVKGVQGVELATVVEAFPFGPFHVPPFSVPGFPDMPTLGGQPPFMYPATPEYLKMMKVSLRQGRLLNVADTRSSQLVAMVNESMAKTLWPGEAALGKCIRAGYGVDPSTLPNPMMAAQFAPCRTIVGVVGDSRARSLRADGFESRQMQYYVPFEQLPVPPFPDFSAVAGLFVKVSTDADRVRADVQRAIQSGLTRPGFVKVRAYQDLIDPQLRSWRLGASLFTAFGGVALFIAAMGLFGVISYLVTQRTREIGVRIAVGATAARLWALVLSDALRLVIVGIVIGLGGAMLGGRYLRELLYRTSPFEPVSLVGAAVVLLSVAVVAALVPARRATRVDPLTALRADG